MTQVVILSYKELFGDNPSFLAKKAKNIHNQNFFFGFWFWGLNSGLVFAKQALYCLGHTSSPSTITTWSTVETLFKASKFFFLSFFLFFFWSKFYLCALGFLRSQCSLYTKGKNKGLGMCSSVIDRLLAWHELGPGFHPQH
jgi:hypothetical protein